MSLTFTPLASSSAGNAYLVRSEGHAPLLIDCGLTFQSLQRKLWAEGVKVSDLAGCLVSHAHLDHCKAVGGLLKAGVDVYASREAWEQMGLAGHRCKVLIPREQCRVVEYIPGITANQDPPNSWKVTAFNAVHDSGGTLGFLVDALNSGNLLYLTDSAYSPYRFDGLTHIAVECNHSAEIMRENALAGKVDHQRYERVRGSHMSIDTVDAMLAANDLSKCREIWLLHLSDANADEEAFKARIQRRFGIPVFVAGR